MIPHFVIFGLPRSRTAWLAHWLAGAGRQVGHDLAITSDTAQDFLDAIWHERAGTCETAAVKAHKLLRTAMPAAKFVTIRRPVNEAIASLARFGITGVDEELGLRDRMLDEAEAAGAERIEYGALANVNVCAALWENLTGVQFNFPWWQGCSQTNIQVKMDDRLTQLVARHPQIERLEAEVAVLLQLPDPKFYRVGLESWASIWADAKGLFEDNHREVGNTYPLALDDALISEAERCGVFLGLSARCNGELVGYASWSIHKNPESCGMILADQGAWYVQPGHPGVGRRLFDVGLRYLRQLGILAVQLHAPMAGRGAKLGALFERLGAKAVQTRYALSLRSR